MNKYIFLHFFIHGQKKILILSSGEMAEWSIAAVLKTVEGYTSWGSNPYFSAKAQMPAQAWHFLFTDVAKTFWS